METDPHSISVIPNVSLQHHFITSITDSGEERQHLGEIDAQIRILGCGDAVTLLLRSDIFCAT